MVTTTTSTSHTFPMTTTALDNQSDLTQESTSSEFLSSTAPMHSSSPNGTVEVCSKPMSYVREPVLSILWHVVYWTSQSLTWLDFASAHWCVWVIDCGHV